MAAHGVQAAAPRHLSTRINWSSGIVGVGGVDGAHSALLVARRSGDPAGQVWIEDLGTHSKPWFAAVCHDVLFLKAAWDAGNKGLEGLDRAHLPTRPGSSGGERLLNFPLSAYTHQPPFWEALEGNSFGQLVLQLRCRRDLARVLFFGDTWDPALPRKRQQERQQSAVGAAQRSLQPPAGGQEPLQPPHKRLRQADGSAAPVQQQQQGRREDPSSPRARSNGSKPPSAQPVLRSGSTQDDSEPVPGRRVSPPPPPPPRPTAGGRDSPAHKARRTPAAADPAKGHSSSSSSSEEEGEASEPQRVPTAAGGARATSGESEGRRKRSRRGLVVASSDSDDELWAVTKRGYRVAPRLDDGKLAAAAGSPEQTGRGRHAGSDSSDSDVPLLARKPKAAAAAAAAASPKQTGRGRHVISDSSDSDVPLSARKRRAAAAGGAAGAAAVPEAVGQPAGARPAQEPSNVWLRPPEFPPGSGKYPFYLKHGPMNKGYFTVAKEASDALLDRGYEGRFEGDLVLRDAATGKTWTLHTNVKDGKQRYLTRTTAFNHANNLQAHDILWLQRGAERGHLLFGVWRWGSREAAEFAAKLGSGKKGGAA